MEAVVEVCAIYSLTLAMMIANLGQGKKVRVIRKENNVNNLPACTKLNPTKFC